MSHNGYKNRATWLVHVWEIVPVLAHNAKKQGVKEISTDWVREAFDELVVQPNMPFDGFIHDIVTSSVNSIDWDCVTESVEEYIKKTTNPYKE